MLTCCMFDAYMLYVSIEVSLHVSLHVSIHVPVLHVACHVKSSFLWLNNWPHSQFNFCLCCAQRQSAYHCLVRVDLDQAMWPHMASNCNSGHNSCNGCQDDGQHSWIHAPAKKHPQCYQMHQCKWLLPTRSWEKWHPIPETGKLLPPQNITMALGGMESS